MRSIHIIPSAQPLLLKRKGIACVFSVTSPETGAFDSGVPTTPWLNLKVLIGASGLGGHMTKFSQLAE
jgi:hypothetical protein